MNIFILHQHPTVAAQYLCNAHVRSQIRESILMLMRAYIHHENEMPEGLPEPDLKHLNHPCTLWVAGHPNHWTWLYKHVGAIFKEYKALHGVPHYWEEYYSILTLNAVKYKKEKRWDDPVPPPSVVSRDLKPHPDFDYSWELVIEAYRKYYQRDKAHLHRWTLPRLKPDWITA